MYGQPRAVQASPQAEHYQSAADLGSRRAQFQVEGASEREKLQLEIQAREMAQRKQQEYADRLKSMQELEEMERR